MKTDNDIDYAANNRFMGEAIPDLQRERDRALHAKYENLKTSFPQIGPFEFGHGSIVGAAFIYDLGDDGKAVFVCHGYLMYTYKVHFFEVHGGIYDAWKRNGGNDGPLGLPVSDEDDYHCPDARPGDRFSKFEHGVIVWRADTLQTEVLIDQAEHQGAGKTKQQHE